MKKNRLVQWIRIAILSHIIILLQIPCSMATGIESERLSNSPATPVPLMSNLHKTAIEDRGIIQVIDGSACGESSRSGRENVISLPGSYNLPEYATDATIILSGWDTQYLNSDHHIGRILVEITNIQQENAQLQWETVGLLRDKNFDDSYRLCYYYTIIAWNRDRINARVLGHRSNMTYSFFNKDDNVALVSAASFIRDSSLTNSVKTAVLPRGFTFGWEEGFDQTDHHLLQIAYNLDHSENYIQAGRSWSGPSPNITNSQASQFVSWETHGIFKDNSTKRDFAFGSGVSVLAGRNIETKQPPFIIIPKEDHRCGELGGDVITQEHVVENVPYDYAIPALTAWELRYPCKDHHVKRLGIWLHDISYEKPFGSNVGTLRYSISSILRDKNKVPLHIPRHKISIIGMNVGALEPLPIPR